MRDFENTTEQWCLTSLLAKQQIGGGSLHVSPCAHRTVMVPSLSPRRQLRLLHAGQICDWSEQQLNRDDQPFNTAASQNHEMRNIS